MSLWLELAHPLFSDNMRVEKAELAYAKLSVKASVDDELSNEVKFIGQES